MGSGDLKPYQITPLGEWGYIGIMEKKMEATSYVRFRV